MTDLEREIATILNTTCGCEGEVPGDKWTTVELLLRSCPDCLPKRMAAAIKAATDDATSGWVGCWKTEAIVYEKEAHDAALRALRGEP